MKLPEEYLDGMKALLGDEYPDYLDAMNEHSYTGLRINTRKISVEEFLKISPFELRPVPWCPEGFYVHAEDRPGTHPYYDAGLYYLQEPSAMIPGSLLPVTAGDRILDACAAPGGKSTQTACRMNGGILVCNDLSASRQAASLRNVERSGIDRTYVTCEDALRLRDGFTGWFDSILLDAPCSGEGMFRKDPSLIRSWHAGIHQEYSALQKELINACADMLRDGGTMVYSTCTFSVEEDEEVILDLLQKHPECRVIQTAAYPGFSPGVLPGTENCVRLYPHRIQGEGHFAAVIRKGGGERIREEERPFEGVLPSFFNDVKMDCTGQKLFRKNDRLYLVPQEDLPVRSLRAIRTGLYIGTEKKNGFEPSQALAMTLSKDTYAQCVSFERDDPRVMKYLRGETVFTDEEYTGWILVCVEQWPLGFAKAAGHTLKNRIDPGWRRH